MINVSALEGKFAVGKKSSRHPHTNMSKAALNMLLKTAAIEQARRYPEARLLSLHPGTVVSPLSQPFRGSAAARPALQAAAELLAVVDNSKASDSGSFVAYDGASVPW